MACGKYAGYHDLLYRDKEYTGEARYLQALLARHAPGAGELLELGCGTGGLAAALAAEGFTVHGVDRSEEMLAFAWERARTEPRLSFSCADLRELPPGRAFPAIVSCFRVFSLFTQTEDLVAAFRAAAARLAGGGMLLFDFWYGPGVLSCRPGVKIRRFGNELLRVVRIEEPELHPERNCLSLFCETLIEDIELQRLSRCEETQVLRYFFLPELETLLGRAGLELVEPLSWLDTERRPDPEDWYALVVARKGGKP